MLQNNCSPSFEGLPYGILVIDREGHLKEHNRKGRQLCTHLYGVCESISALGQNKLVHSVIWSCCQRYMKIYANSPEEGFTWQENLTLEKEIQCRICINWISFGEGQFPVMLVTIEDLSETARRQAQCDAVRYGLTQREAEYWTFVCQGLSRTEITQRMYISINTVKKYARNVKLKRLSAV